MTFSYGSFLLVVHIPVRLLPLLSVSLPRPPSLSPSLHRRCIKRILCLRCMLFYKRKLCWSTTNVVCKHGKLHKSSIIFLYFNIRIMNLNAFINRLDDYWFCQFFKSYPTLWSPPTRFRLLPTSSFVREAVVKSTMIHVDDVKYFCPRSCVPYFFSFSNVRGTNVDTSCMSTFIWELPLLHYFINTVLQH